MKVGDRVRAKGRHIGTVREIRPDGRVLVHIVVEVYTGHSRTDRHWYEAGDLEPVDEGRGPAMRDFVPGYIAAVQGTPIQTAANLPGGGALFETCAKAAEPEREQLGLDFQPAGEADFGELEKSHPLACERERAKARVAAKRAARLAARKADR